MEYRSFSFTDKIHKCLGPRIHETREDIETIKRALLSDEPCMIARLGSVELQALALVRYFPLSIFLKKRSFRQIRNNAGFFPVSMKSLKAFYKVYRDAVKEMDLLVRWRVEELLFGDWLNKKKYVHIYGFHPFFQPEHPWTFALKGKRILVVHPFADTIESQYKNHRKDLFENEEMLPEFASLQTVKAVQSIAGNPVGFSTWFEALDWMKTEIDKKDFDIALLGCGAYGVPLAAHIKQIGKKAVYMGGVLQMLFGIKGSRFECSKISSPFINEYFVYPDDADRPENADFVEGGCYWGPKTK